VDLMNLSEMRRTLTLLRAAERNPSPSAMAARLERHKDSLPPRLGVA
jgi:hypothetical protein